VVDFLQKLFKSAAKDRWRLEASLNKLPFTLGNSAPKETADKIITELEKLGAKAVFEPAAVKQTPPSSEVKPALEAPPATQSKSRIAAGGAMKLTADKTGAMAHIEPAKPEAPPKAASSRYKKATLPIAAALAIIVLGGAGAYYWMNGSGGGKASSLGPLANPAARAAAAKKKTAGELFAEFDRAHAPMFDRRMADGLAEAVREYVRLFHAGPVPARVEVTYTHERVETHAYKLKYEIKAQGAVALAEALLSTHPERNGENIPALVAALAEMVGKLGTIAPPPAAIQKASSSSAGDEAREAMAKLDAPAVFRALNALGKSAGPSKVDPGALLEAGNLLFWMAYIKSCAERHTLEDLLGVHAVANHLLASLFMDQADSALVKGRALALLGLGYPATALATLSGAPGADMEWTAMVAKRDAAGVERAAKADLAYRRLGGYLSARLARENGWYGDSLPKILIMLKEDSDFVLGAEYAITYGGVETGRLAGPYLMETAKRSIEIMSEFLDMPGMERGGASAILAAKDDPDALQKIAKAASDVTAAPKDDERILTRRLVSEYVSENLMDAVLLCFWVNETVFAEQNAAQTFLDLIKRTWPGSPVAQLAEIRRLWRLNQYEPVEAVTKKVDIKTADSRLLEEMAEFHVWNSDHNMPRVMQILAELRAKTNPTPAAALRQERTYWRLGYHPVSGDMVRRAMKLDPYNMGAYYHVGGLPEAGNLIKTSGLLYGGSARFLMAAGEWAEKSGKIEDAMAYYRRAILLTRTDVAADGLTNLHLKRKEYAQAEQVMRDFLKRDDGSFGYIHSKNLLAKALLGQGKAQEVHQMMKDAKESGQGGSIINFAKAAEMMGVKVEAEIFFRMAADRYQSGQSPVDLAMFHLRNGGRAAAAEDLRSYQRYNNYSYFYKAAAEHFKAQGKPEDTVDFVTEVENGKLAKDHVYTLWQTLMAAGAPETAAKLVKPHMAGPGPEQPFVYAGLYIAAMKKADPQSAKAAFGEAMKALSDDKRKLKYFGGWLHQREMYQEAFAALDAFTGNPAERAGDIVMVMAAAWLMAGAEPEGKAALQSRLKEPAMDPWVKLLVEYYIGGADEESLLAQGAANGRIVEALYAMGLHRLSKGETEEAQKLFITGFKVGNPKFAEYGFSIMASRKETKMDNDD
jgi:tetratricopeptide (TPR) repeat protein